MVKSLVTGATGFIGANLVRKLLEKNHKIMVILREESRLWRIKDLIENPQIIFCYKGLEGNYKAEIKEFQPDYIFHLATYGAYPDQQKNAEQTIQTNVMGTINLIESLSDIDYKGFVNIGSSSEYGPKKQPMSESDCVEPTDLYGITKIAAQLYTKMIVKNQGKPIVHLRLFSNYGPYEEPTRLIASLMSAMNNQEKVFELTSGTQTRDFIHVSDVVNALIICAERAEKIKGKIINIGTGKKTPIREVAELAKKVARSSIELKFGAKKTRDVETFIWVANTELMKKELSWFPELNLEQGLLETWNWVQKYENVYQNK